MVAVVGADPLAVASVDRRLIRHPKFTQIIERIGFLPELTRRAGEPRCGAIEGVPGAGKSTLVKEFASSYPRRETAGGTVVPVLYTEVPASVTVKQMAERMLCSLGDPAGDKGTLTSRTMRLVHLLQQCEVRFVIVDDVHNMIDADTERVIMSVARWLKTVIKQSGVIFVIVGVEGRVRRILDANEELRRLFAWLDRLPTFAWDPANPSTVVEFASLVACAEQVVGMPLVYDSRVRLAVLCRRHVATGGVIANLMDLLHCAAAKAEERGRREIDQGLLSLAYREAVAVRLNVPDPFAAAAVPVPGGPVLVEAAPAVDGRRRPRRERGPRLVDVLRT